MIGDKLKEIREHIGKNKKEFADYIGIKYTTYNGYETGSREPASDFLILISKKFDVSIDYLLGLQEESEVLHSYELKNYEYDYIKKYRILDSHGRDIVDTILDKEVQRINKHISLDAHPTTLIEFHPKQDSKIIVLPYFPAGASAGTGLFILGNEAEDEIELPALPEYEAADYAIDVKGHSMEPDYSNGDIALVSQYAEMFPGDIGVFVINGEAYIKELGVKELISHNQDYDNIPIRESDNVVCMGKVIGKVHE